MKHIDQHGPDANANANELIGHAAHSMIFFDEGADDFLSLVKSSNTEESSQTTTSSSKARTLFDFDDEQEKQEKEPQQHQQHQKIIEPTMLIDFDDESITKQEAKLFDLIYTKEKQETKITDESANKKENTKETVVKALIDIESSTIQQKDNNTQRISDNNSSASSSSSTTSTQNIKNKE